MSNNAGYRQIEGLLDLACRDGVDIRSTLLRVLTDLYVQKTGRTPAEEAQYTELAQRLIESVDAATRATVASKLAAYPEAPQSILRQLSKSVGIPEVRASEPSAATPNTAEAELLELFLAAGPDERRLILTNLDAATPAMSARASHATPDMIRRLEHAALQQNGGAFARILEQTLTVNRALIERLVHDPSGEPIVVAAKALRIKPDVFQRILLFLNPAIGQSVQRVYELARLFDEMTPAAATQMVEIWRMAGGRRRAAYQPLHADDERMSARRLASHAGRSASRERADRSSARRKAGR